MTKKPASQIYYYYFFFISTFKCLVYWVTFFFFNIVVPPGRTFDLQGIQLYTWTLKDISIKMRTKGARKSFETRRKAITLDDYILENVARPFDSVPVEGLATTSLYYVKAGLYHSSHHHHPGTLHIKLQPFSRRMGRCWPVV